MAEQCPCELSESSNVRRDSDTLLVTRGLPWLMVYEADLSRDNRSDETVYAFQSRIR